LGLMSFAISNTCLEPLHVESAARFAVRLAENLLEHGLPADTVLNVNVPDLPYDELTGVSVTRMGRRHYQDEIIHRVDPRGRAYYWIGGAQPTHVTDTGTDFEAIEHNRVSVTPLHRDMTNHGVLAELARKGLAL
ncbi:MAG: 5/3-nucleotidase, partial [Candidatus Hydrogenedentes bacterium]|nr:5/3-nucleotidase [Candidatus Hydrogenedentota bacterium]